MLEIIVPGIESFDESNNEFVTVGDEKIQLEHSLASMSKWESIFEKPFLGKEEKSNEETVEYIRLMLLTPVSKETFKKLALNHISEISEYITSKQTATFFNEPKTDSSRAIITSELLYYWMFSLGIPLECENWHLNRLFTLIKVFNLKNTKQKKMSPSELAARNRELNAQRRAQYGTKG